MHAGPSLPPLVPAGRDVLTMTPHYTRDLPYSFDSLVENVVDPGKKRVAPGSTHTHKRTHTHTSQTPQIPQRMHAILRLWRQ